MNPTALIQLINSLSKSEKRQLKLLSRKQSGQKDYIRLFDLIEHYKIVDKTTLVQKFKSKYPRLSLQNNCRYLFNSILEALIQTRTKNYSLYELFYGIMKVQIMNERNLTHEGYKELLKLKPTAEKIQNSILEYFLMRMELKYHLDENFLQISETALITLQMKARDSVRQIRNTHEHFSLYELLKLRLLAESDKLSVSQKAKLNDLLLSEMGVVNARVKHNLESQKLHLLFQSFFFTNTGDYKAAFKTFYELNKLFEADRSILQNPPLDYFTALDGILDNLRTNEKYIEMDYYLNRLPEIQKNDYPEYFCFLVKKTEMSYRLISLIGQGKIDLALHEILQRDASVWKLYPLADEQKQNELLFNMALVYFHTRKFKKAQKFINQIIMMRKINQQLIIYKAARLLNLIMSYETGEFEFLGYEIKAYKRTFSSKITSFKIEKLIFNTIKMDPDHASTAKNKVSWKSIKPSIEAAEKDLNEKQLLKYFDFANWIKGRFGIA